MKTTTTNTTVLTVLTEAGLTEPIYQRLGADLHTLIREFRDCREQIQRTAIDVERKAKNLQDEIEKGYTPGGVTWVAQAAGRLAELRVDHDRLVGEMKSRIYFLSADLEETTVREALHDLAFGSTEA